MFQLNRKSLQSIYTNQQLLNNPLIIVKDDDDGNAPYCKGVSICICVGAQVFRGFVEKDNSN